jgi:hypothetical protein
MVHKMRVGHGVNLTTKITQVLVVGVWMVQTEFIWLRIGTSGGIS